jgi:hypothetical protein
LTTAATMIAFINSIVAGASVTLLVNGLFGGDRIVVAITAGIATAVGLVAVFLAYQQRRYAAATPREAEPPQGGW